MRTYTADEVDAMIGRALARERERVAQQQEPVLWQILNGVCHAGVRSTENLAKEAAAGMQKTHDLGGSLAAFHVRPLYTSPPAQRKPLTDEEQIAEALRRHGLTLIKTTRGYDVLKLGQINAHGIKENT